MRATAAVRSPFCPASVAALLAVLLLGGAAEAGISRVRGSAFEPPAGKLVSASANLLYTDPAMFLRRDLAVSEEAAGGGLSTRPGGAPSFWLPDSLETGWRARDKKLHFLACYSVVLTGDLVTDRVDTGAAWAAGLSVAKELWDLWYKTPVSQRGVSMGDLAADAVGVVAAVIAVEALGD